MLLVHFGLLQGPNQTPPRALARSARLTSSLSLSLSLSFSFSLSQALFALAFRPASFLSSLGFS